MPDYLLQLKRRKGSADRERERELGCGSHLGATRVSDIQVLKES